MFDFIDFRIQDAFDIVLVAALLYGLYRLLKGTTAVPIFIGVVTIYLLSNIIDSFQMEMLSKILSTFTNVGFIALIVIFQPEIRSFLVTVGTEAKKRNFMKKFKLGHKGSIILDTQALTVACQNMSDIQQGALIIVTRENQLDDIAGTGVEVNANITNSLIENIFFKNSPLHDGAMIISDNRIRSARCILPVTSKTNIPGHYGLRHRAAIGVTEDNDCFVLVVSEETGNISLVKGGEIRTIERQSLKVAIEQELG